MRRILFALILAIVAIPASAQLCTEIPLESERDLRLAAYRVMSTVLAESDVTPYHEYRLQLAKQIANSPGEWWRVLAEYRQASVTNCSVNWSGLSYDQLYTNMSNAWTEVARLRFEPIPVP